MSLSGQPAMPHHHDQTESDGNLEPRRRSWYLWPGWLLGRVWDIASLLVLLSITAAIPIAQFAALGYILRAAGNLAAGRPWPAALPGSTLAGRMGTFALWAAVLWLPVWLVADLAYSVQLLEPDSHRAALWRWATLGVSCSWGVYVAWAAIRGGRWWHFLWPAPIAFIRRAWRPSTLGSASDRFYQWVQSFQFPELWWLGARATIGVLLWTGVPVSMMIIGQRASGNGAGLIGLIGAVLMIGVFFYLPFLQIQLAVTNRFAAMFNLRSIRRDFGFAPLAYGFGLVALGLLCLPLYLLRIEMPPSELRWVVSLVFVLLMLPAKWVLAAGVRYSLRRQAVAWELPRHWTLRWAGRLIGLASAIIYIGFLYLGQLIADQGAWGMYFQHAFLAPAPT